ncbi:MAG: PDZ domain-containing protein [Bacilli bacterium]|nr:PDZ domain-containing protein [Bacilli bacterium]
MLQKLKTAFEKYILDDIVFYIIMILLFIICNIPLNYYVTIGGGISDASSRIKVDDSYSSKGSFNISYVTQADANVFIYLVSYLFPTWERENADLYKYSQEENFDDIQFRSDLDLKSSNGISTYWAYTLAEKSISVVSEKNYVIAVFPKEYPTELKIKDEILSIDGHTFQNLSELKEYLQQKNAGDIVKINVLRDKKNQEIETTIYEKNGIKLLGINVQFVREYDTDPDVEIKFKKKESGPSGGLITTLEMYNQLTKKDLTKGKIIAGTGTIEEDGSIGEIGGITHKILGAVKAHADIFLSPGGDNYKEAKAYIKEKKLKIKLVKVETIQEAIEKLENLS